MVIQSVDHNLYGLGLDSSYCKMRMMIKIKVTFLTVCWQEENEDVCYHWQSPGQRDIIREMFHLKKKKRKGRRKWGREGGGLSLVFI